MRFPTFYKENTVEQLMRSLLIMMDSSQTAIFLKITSTLNPTYKNNVLLPIEATLR